MTATSTNTTKVAAHGKLHGRDIEAEVINPGGWFGKVWLIEVGCGYSSSFYAVEADHLSDALDEFVGSDIGKKQVGIPECAYGDYGYDVNPGDRIAGGVATAKGKVNLKGEFFPDGDDRGVYLSEPYHGDGGDVADLDHVSCHGEECGKTPWPCVYAVPGREEMIPAVEYGLPNYDVTRDDHDGVQAAGFKSEDAAEAFIAAKIKAGEGEDWEWNIVEVPCPYA